MMRLSKYLSEQNICSRREAELFIDRGWLKVDGVVIQQQGFKVPEHCSVELSQQALDFQNQLVTVLLNKPIGYVSTQPEKNYPSATTLITKNRQYFQAGKVSEKNVEWPIRGLSAAGRLDIDSTGLLVLTQDGRISKKLIAPDSNIEKEYLIRADQNIQERQVEQLRSGMSLDGKRLKQAEVNQLDDCYFRMVLTEGKKRQIRRMCEQVGLKVLALKRVRIGSVRLGSLPLGRWRFLAKNETF